ncbi:MULTISPECIES: SDR family oxidoreductase [Deinococcus]|jgi:NAD(P)-dependent dehydrogenase (short-subunit alcohol dehydrogenase family)|uniref:NAD(P)-dependent dehydrogenase (Short-subunit alcohol dehydrogenase family) n=2 Tax=Deinococcus soli (ex Cha et al. 2016) TaxID=1309411 RepID=A0ACC6KFH6_9DEIO|nr:MULTISPECIES: SDR family oxidoreductase [Deinococcus]MDK2014135.1 SDR family oxidoreductase [Deinococcus sp. 43]MDR6218095.1 NAD(P)-dependent dehydrogenase (short-subunit alcohol dehydrogenase family) [Deinococcus soli (ex Cha et al. 2016)]MDR6328345.1 NAD(P)-dependent dehydrogenase (short-subunit alcohol dehydrogenase family) [Deinococcus soli (ex Cha et al. 2016)]MDR6751197.1 NAD(P)-dependent dehydrogenase (short-subunit alcohol dehydrogenase family) [Deinococcus soli (ex Cha et al. 2016)]
MTDTQPNQPETAPTDAMPQQMPGDTQSQQPGSEAEMTLAPVVIRDGYQGSGRLRGKVALISGGDSGIGRAVAVHFAREGADVAVIYLDETEDARATLAMIEAEGQRGLLLAGDIGDHAFCKDAVRRTVERLGGLNVLVNNAAEQHPQESVEDITPEQLERTFRTNIFAMFYLVQAALSHLQAGDSVINTTSVTAYRGSPGLLDYSSTKGAIVAFTRSLSGQLAKRQIRVNAVAPGPIWTPLIPSTFDTDKVASFGQDVPLGRAGQPAEVAPAFVFLASDDASYVTGQVIHPNGGEIING